MLPKRRTTLSNNILRSYVFPACLAVWKCGGRKQKLTGCFHVPPFGGFSKWSALLTDAAFGALVRYRMPRPLLEFGAGVLADGVK
jgi:hypothetical protein